MGRTQGEHALVDELLHLRVEAQSTVTNGEMNPRKTGIELSAEERNGAGALGWVLGKQFGDEVVDATLFGGQHRFGNGHIATAPRSRQAFSERR
ncbi:unannotated protein [freshwater metagenome]|uniref:Unannotated protein n=1 Tax=freshwater metagenome TaxID=449393 RepID=A0A6J6P325_9ZZZZ